MLNTLVSVSLEFSGFEFHISVYNFISVYDFKKTEPFSHRADMRIQNQIG